MDFREWPSNSKTMSLQQVSSSEGSSKMVRDGDSVRFHDDDNNNFDGVTKAPVMDFQARLAMLGAAKNNK